MQVNQQSCSIFSLRTCSYQRHVQSSPFTSSSSRPCPFRAHASSAEAHKVPDRRSALLAGGLLAGLLAADLDALAASGTVFVAGAAGKTGREVVKYLTSKGFAVRAGVRNIDKAKASGLDKGGKVTLVNGDVTSGVDALAAAMGDASAVVCATGYGGFDAAGFDKVDRLGTIALVDAAKQQGKVSKFVLLSSLLTNGAAKGQTLNPSFLVLNVFGGVLSKKHEAELYLRQSGLDWTIVRPGGLSADPPEQVGNLVVRGEDTLFGLPGDPGRSISRVTVAEVLAEAVLQPQKSRNRVVEIVSSKSVPQPPPEQIFS